MKPAEVLAHLRSHLDKPLAKASPARAPRTYALLVAEENNEYGDELARVWWRHSLLGTEGGAECYAEMLEAVLEIWPDPTERQKAEEDAAEAARQDGFDEGKEAGASEGYQEGRAAGYAAAREEIGDVRSADEQAAALDDERRRARAEVLQKLQAAMVLPAKNLRRNVQQVVVDLLRQINGAG